jgi:hypothetical protein
MGRSKGVVYGTVAITLLVVVASGPLVAGIDFTRDRASGSAPAPGIGSAELSIASVPTVATLDRGAYGARSYYLRVPDATVGVESVAGQPLLVYTIRLPELGYAHGSVYALDSTTPGRLTLSLEPDALDPARVDRRAYEGTLAVLLRSGEDERVLYREPITVEVDR